LSRGLTEESKENFHRRPRRTQRGVAATTKDAVSASLKTGVACSQVPRGSCRRSVPLYFWKTVRTVSDASEIITGSELWHARVSYPSLCALRGLLCKIFLLPSVRARLKSGSLKSSRNCAIFDVSSAKRWGTNSEGRTNSEGQVKYCRWTFLDMPRRIAQERVPTASNAGSRDVTWVIDSLPDLLQ